VTSNLVYVLVLSTDRPHWSDITFLDIVVERRRYFHPVGGGKGGWPRTPPNYLGFRYSGRLQHVHHVEHYEVMTRPHEHIPEIHEGEDWTSEPHFLYHLGPPVQVPDGIRTGASINFAQRVWAALDLLLTSPTIADARDATRARHEAAGIRYP
jgi:hypothetical protein